MIFNFETLIKKFKWRLKVIKTRLIELKLSFSKSEYKFIKAADVIICSGDANKSYIYKDKFYSFLLDPLAEYLKSKNYKLVAISKPGSKYYKDQTYMGYLNINREFFRSKIKNYFSSIDEEILFWKKILKKIRPKIIICHQPLPALCFAAKQSNIMIADLQHGLISNLVYYNLNNPYGKKGLPNLFLCWDKISRDYLKKILPNFLTYIVGNPWISKFEKNNSNNFIELENRKLKSIISKRPVILVTLQFKKGETKIIDIPKHVLKSLEILISKGWDCWVKFHPAHVKEFSKRSLYKSWDNYTNLKINSNNVFDVTNNVLPHLFRFTNVHITDHSACIIESKMMKINSYFWSDDRNMINNLIKPYLNKSFINKAPKNVKKLVNVLNRHRKKRKYFFNNVNKSEMRYTFFTKKFRS